MKIYIKNKSSLRLNLIDVVILRISYKWRSYKWRSLYLPQEGSMPPQLTHAARANSRQAGRAKAQRIYCSTEGRTHWQPAEQYNY